MTPSEAVNPSEAATPGEAVTPGYLLAAMATEAQGYDDEALAHLANKGLVRRATKLLDKPHSASGSDGAVVVDGDDWSVSFTAGQPLIDGSCGCATTGACQHLIAAIIVLRSLDVADGAGRPEATAASDSDEPGAGTDTTTTTETPGGGWEPIQAALLTLADGDLLAWTRKADGRWAMERAAGLDVEQVVIDRGVNLGVDLPPPHGSVRFLGPTLDAAVVKPTTRHDRRVVGLAVLALWLRSGRDLPVASDGDDGGVPATELPAERVAVARRAQELAATLVRIGLLHVGDREREQLDGLAASARGAKLYRLSLLAERASDHLVAITERSPQGDTGTLLNQLAEINIVAEVIERSLLSGAPLSDGLVGQARSRFEPVGQLELAALGHYRWGDQRFAGTTSVLFDRTSSAGSRVYTVSKPRIVAGRSLGDAIGWTGVGTAVTLTGNRVTVSNAKASDQLRLSTTEAVVATMGPALDDDDLGALAWNGTAPGGGSRLLGRRGSRWALCPVDGHNPETAFDNIAQRLEWRFVSRGQTIAASIPYRTASAQAITNLERLVAASRASDPESDTTIRYVVGRLGRGGDTTRRGDGDNERGRVGDGALSIWPIAVVTDRLVNLAGASVEAADSGGSGWFANLTGALNIGGHPPAGSATATDDPTTPPDIPTADERLATRLLRIAERGQHHATADELDQLAATARNWGFGVLTSVLEAAATPPVAVLRTAWTHRLIADTQSLGDD